MSTSYEQKKSVHCKEHTSSSTDVGIGTASDGLARAAISNNNNVSTDECGLCGWGQTNKMCISCVSKK